MKRGAIDPVTGQSIPAKKTNEHFPRKYLPRIMCLDCPGKLYTPGPGESVEDFEIHLKVRLHRDKVDARLAKEIAELELLYRTAGKYVD
jgi:SWI/SNF-related matrix-associated actin-dependent regulator of chromatin subfamily B member 1